MTIEHDGRFRLGSQVRQESISAWEPRLPDWRQRWDGVFCSSDYLDYVWTQLGPALLMATSFAHRQRCMCAGTRRQKEP